MAWMFVSGRPLAVQMADRLRGEILSGAYSSGEQFPTVRALAEMASVNPNTVQRALLLLEGEGLLVTKGTVGRFVTEDEAILAAARVSEKEKFVLSLIEEAKKKQIECEELISYIQKGWDNA
jgi:DNA-binding transcriptional regulator YhcF (GntR family)